MERLPKDRNRFRKVSLANFFFSQVDPSQGPPEREYTDAELRELDAIIIAAGPPTDPYEFFAIIANYMNEHPRRLPRTEIPNTEKADAP